MPRKKAVSPPIAAPSPIVADIAPQAALAVWIAIWHFFFCSGVKIPQKATLFGIRFAFIAWSDDGNALIISFKPSFLFFSSSVRFVFEFSSSSSCCARSLKKVNI